MTYKLQNVFEKSVSFITALTLVLSTLFSALLVPQVAMADTITVSDSGDSKTLDANDATYNATADTSSFENISLSFAYDVTALDGGATTTITYSAGSKNDSVNVTGTSTTSTKDSDTGTLTLDNISATSSLTISISVDASNFSGSSDSVVISNITLSGTPVATDEAPTIDSVSPSDGNQEVATGTDFSMTVDASSGGEDDLNHLEVTLGGNAGDALLSTLETELGASNVGNPLTFCANSSHPYDCDSTVSDSIDSALTDLTVAYSDTNETWTLRLGSSTVDELIAGTDGTISVDLTVVDDGDNPSSSQSLSYTLVRPGGSSGGSDLTPTSSTIVVKPGDTHGWVSVDDNGNGGNMSYVTGPGTPPEGAGSAELSVDTTDQGYLLANPAYGGTMLSDISTLSYSTYVQNGNGTIAPSVQLNVTSDVTNTSLGWQGRLVYEPYMNGTVTDGEWQMWQADEGKWWLSHPEDFDGNCGQSNPCTFTELEGLYSNIGINVGTLQMVGFKAGSGWTNFVGNVDALHIVTADSDVLYDFEGAPADSEGISVTPYKNGFEDSDAADSWNGTIDRVSSGTNGIDAATGDWYANIAEETNTYWNNMGSNVFPTEGYTTEIDVYLDMSKADGSSTKSIFWNGGINDTSASNLEETSIVVRTDPDTANQWQIDFRHTTGGLHKTDWVNVTGTGWYTLQRHYYEGTDGYLYIEQSVLDADENVIATHTFGGNALGYVVDDNVGGADYSWFPAEYTDFATVPADNACLYLGGPTANGCNFNAVPDIKRGPAERLNIPENQMEVFDFDATDADGDDVNFSIASGADKDLFTVSDDGQLSFKVAPDYEDPTDSNGNNEYRVNLEASDGNGGVYELTVYVVIEDVDEAPEASGVVLNGETIDMEDIRTENGEDVRNYYLIGGVLDLEVNVNDDHDAMGSVAYKVRKVGDNGNTHSGVFSSYKQRLENSEGNTWITDESVFDTSDVDTSKDPDGELNGEYTIQFILTDAAGNKSNAYVDVLIDNTAPIAQITTPTEDGIVSGTVLISGSIEDENPDHYYLVVRDAEGSVVAGPATVNEATVDDYEWDTTDVPDGIYQIFLAARDVVDNRDENSEDSVMVTVDNTDPNQVIGLAVYDDAGEITDGNTTDKTVRAQWNIVSDAREYEYCYWNDIASSGYNSEADCYTTYPTTNQLSGSYNQGEGEHFVKVRAIDEAGNKGDWSDIVSVTYDTTPSLLASFTFSSGGSGGIAEPVSLGADGGEVLGAQTSSTELQIEALIAAMNALMKSYESLSPEKQAMLADEMAATLALLTEVLENLTDEFASN